MPLDPSVLKQTDEVPYPGCDKDEYVRIRRVKGYIKDTELQAEAVTLNEETDEREFDGRAYQRNLMRWMVVGDGHIKKPDGGIWCLSEDEEFDQFIDLLGDWLMAEITKRGHGIAPKIRKGAKDADGEPLTFPQADAVRAGQDVESPPVLAGAGAGRARHGR